MGWLGVFYAILCSFIFLIIMFNLTFLGTSSGIPTHERNVSAVAIECMANTHTKRHAWILVDCGEGTQHQLLKSHLSLGDLSAILITHAHGDHCFGLGGLLASLGMHGRKKPLTLIAPRAVFELLDTLKRVSDLHLSYDIHAVMIEDNLTQTLSLTFGDEHYLSVNIYELSHRIASFGFRVVQHLQKHKLLTDKLTQEGIANKYWSSILKADTPISIEGRLINPCDFQVCLKSKIGVVIAGDNDEPWRLNQAVVGVSALVHEATHTEEVRQKLLNKPADKGGFDPKHSSVKMVATFAQAHQIPTLILTHFSARYASFDDETSKTPNMGHVRAEGQRHYDGKLILAKDFLQVLIDEPASA